MEVIDQGYIRPKPHTEEELNLIERARRDLRHWLYEAQDDCDCTVCEKYSGHKKHKAHISNN